MEKAEFNTNSPFNLFFEAVDSKNKPLKNTGLKLGYEDSLLFVKHAAYDFFDTSILIYIENSPQDNIVHVGLEWDNLKDLDTDYNNQILNHYEKLTHIICSDILKWLRSNKAYRWVIYGMSNHINKVEKITLTNYIPELPEVIKNWKE